MKLRANLPPMKKLMYDDVCIRTKSFFPGLVGGLSHGQAQAGRGFSSAAMAWLSNMFKGGDEKGKDDVF